MVSDCSRLAARRIKKGSLMKFDSRAEAPDRDAFSLLGSRFQTFNARDQLDGSGSGM
jgi:hypothetical protein